MTLNQIVKIQSIFDKRAIRSDTLEFLNETRFSKSKQMDIKYGDMHIDHFIRVVANMNDEDTLATIITKIVEQRKKNLN